jgi:thymidylate synthase (FAD)
MGQDRDEYAKLLKYCIDHGHWSIFEMANMVLEIETTRGIAAQILRHRSFSFQEFSQRYADTNLIAEDIPAPDLRSQDKKNRQNSLDNLADNDKITWSRIIEDHFRKSQYIYDEMLKVGIAKECARFVLPLATPTRMYMNGTIRSWITYIALREKNGTQKEHIDIAMECKRIFCNNLPITSEALGGFDKKWCI